MVKRPTHVWSLATSPPHTHTHDGAKTHLSPQVIPMVELLVTTWTGDAVDSEGLIPWIPSPQGITPDSQGPPQHAGAALSREECLREKRQPRGTHGQEGPRHPAPPASQGCSWEGREPDSCPVRGPLWALESPGPGRRPQRWAWPASPASCRLSLSLESQGRAGGTAGHTQGADIGK